MNILRMKSLSSSTESESSSVTGLHFIYPGLLVFYVEGSEEDINDFIRLLNNLTAKEALGLTKVKVVHIVHNIKVVEGVVKLIKPANDQNQMLSNWHWKVVDPPIRTERMESHENKIRLVRMILHIVVSLSKQPPLAVKKTLENLQVE